jgi:hypothetical protein
LLFPREITMHHSYRVFPFLSAVLGAFVLLGTPAFGSSAGFREYVAQQHAVSFALPVLHGHIPVHVPTFTNEGAIRFWESHPNSEVLRNSAFEVQLCEAVTTKRNLDAGRFDHVHPVLGHILRDPQFLQYALHLYRSHPSRFVHYHHHLIAVLRGCAMMMENTLGTLPEVVQNPITTPVNPAPENIGNGPVPVTPTGPQPMAAVPAPHSLVLLAIGLGCMMMRIRRCIA